MIVLAAGTGSRLHPLTADRPKCLVPVAGKPILEHVLESATEVGLRDVVLVGGYKAEALDRYGRKVVVNERYAQTNMVESLFCAEAYFEPGFVLSYGDIIYTPSVLRRCASATSPVSVVVDKAWRSYWEARFADPLADAESLRIDQHGLISDIGRKVGSLDEIEAQYIGLLAFRGVGVQWLRQARQSLGQEARRAFMTDLIMRLIEMGRPVSAVPIEGQWAEVDSVGDIAVAERRMREAW